MAYSTVDAGHYGTEKHFVEFMAGVLSEEIPHLDYWVYEGRDVFQLPVRVLKLRFSLSGEKGGSFHEIFI